MAERFDLGASLAQLGSSDTTHSVRLYGAFDVMQSLTVRGDVLMVEKAEDIYSLSATYTMDSGLCLRALEKALARTGRVPEIFNTDQGCQFTSEEWIARLTDLGVRISMDGRGRWMDNVFIERLWRSVKYEDIYLREYGTIPELLIGLKRWFDRYNGWRPHETLGNLTPDQVYKTRPSEQGEANAAKGEAA